MPRSLKRNSVFNDLPFNMALSVNGDVAMAEDDKAIKQSIYNILNTVSGSRPINPDFGCNLNKYLFEPYGKDTAQLIGDDIYRNIGGEPRITPISIDIQMNDSESSYSISITYKINTTMQTDAITFTLQAL
jgi:phage baseplate assembly protein W